MAKKTKKLLFITVILSLLFISSTYAALIPNVHAAETTILQEGLAVTNNVIGIDLAKYATSSEYKQDSYLGVFPQENLRYTLATEGSTLDLYYTFVNGKLQKIHVLEAQGNLQMQKALSANSLENSKDFLSNYQGYSKNTFYGELGSTLNTVDANKNLTTIYGNTKLSVTVQDNSATYRWTYTLNGIDAPDKCVALHYEDGFLSYFVDNWDIYKIGSTNVNLSEQQAIDIAMAKAKAFTWATVSDNKTFEDLKYNVTNAMVWNTVFANSLFMDNPRGQDPLMLYPMRHIWVSFDKFYPCNVYGMNVYLWADTGEIGHIQERFSTMDPPADLMATSDDILAVASDDQASGAGTTESNLLSVPWIMLLSFVALTLGTVTVYLGRKKTLLRSFGFPKLRSFKIGGVLLCLLAASTVLIAVLAPTANALPLYGRATIWGSESSDAWNSTLNLSWRKHPDEVTRQVATSAFIQSKFDQNGYYASDYQGIKGSVESSILYQIETNQVNYPRVAAIDFDHGNGNIGIPGLPSEDFHYMFEDQRGTFSGPVCHSPPPDHPEYGVYDYEIYPKTNLGKYFFVLINACNSAHVNTTYYGQWPSTQGMVNGRARGMPFAWTWRLVKNRDTYQWFNTADHMSDDGYARPDNGAFVYLGFYKGSASLTQDVEGLNGPRPYWWWLEHFFAYALTNNWSVKQALNEASQQFYEGNFGEIPLHTGYTAIWPMFYSDPPGQQHAPYWGNPYWHYGSGEQGPGSQMLVYGNSNIKLYQPLLTLSANGGLSPTFTIDGQSYSTGNHRVISDIYTINVNDILNYAFTHFSYKGINYGRPANIPIASDGELTAHYTLVQQPLTVSSSGSGYTNLTGTKMCDPFTYEPVEAFPDPGYDHYWLLNNKYAGSNPTINVYINGPQTLQAVFYPEQTHYFAAAIDSYEDHLVYYPENLTGWQSDWQFAGLEGWGPYEYYGWISGAMNKQATGHIYMYGACAQGYPGHLYVYVSNNGNDWNFVSSPYVSSTSPYWIDCGTYQSTFNYIKVTVENPQEFVVIGIDTVRVEPPIYYTLSISSSGEGHTDPTGEQQYPDYTYAHVVADADPGWTFDYWLLNGTNAGTNPSIDVYMDANYILQANFREETPPVYHWLTINAYDEYGYPLSPNVYVDTVWYYGAPVTIQVTEDWHIVEVEDPYVYWCLVEFSDGYGNGASRPIYSDTTITAYYQFYY
jgi:hypothetical protein